jgi:hypothetical protein
LERKGLSRRAKGSVGFIRIKRLHVHVKYLNNNIGSPYSQNSILNDCEAFCNAVISLSGAFGHISAQSFRPGGAVLPARSLQDRRVVV